MKVLRYRRNVTVLLAVATVWSFLLVGAGRVSPDERENLATGYNLATYNVASSAVGAGPPEADYRREPLYPLLLSLVLRPGEPDLTCLLEGGSDCAARNVALRSVNAVVLVLLAGLTYTTGRLLMPDRGAVAAAALVAFSPALAHYSGKLLTETLAAALLLAGTHCLIRLRQSDKKRWWAAGAGAAFGFLILVKALFLFVLPLVAVAMLMVTGGRRLAAPMAVMVGVAMIVIAPWSLRNLSQFGSPMVTSGSSSVLAVRAAALDMSGAEYASSFVFNTEVIGPRAAAALFPERDYARHDRTNPEGFFGQRAEYETVAVDAILDRPAKHLSLSLPFAWSGAFGAVPIGTPPPSWWPTPISRAYYSLAAAGVLLRWVAFGALFVASLSAVRRPNWRPLLVPALLLFIAYATTTHFIPRYGQPLLPIAYLCLALLTSTRQSGSRYPSKPRPGVGFERMPLNGQRT